MAPLDVTSQPSPSFDINLFRTEAEKISRALGIVIIFSGILANILTIRAFYKMGLKDSASIVFFNLAIADLCVLFFASISFCFFYLNNPPVFSYYMPIRTTRLFALAAKQAFYESSTFLTTFLAVQRCLCVVFPIRFKTWFNRRNTFIIMSVMWGICLAQAILKTVVYWPTYTIFRKPNSTIIYKIELYQALHNIGQHIRTIINLFLRPICSFIVIVALFAMAHALKQSMQFRKKASSFSHSASKPEHDLTKEDEAKTKDKTSGSASATNTSSKERQVIVQVTLVLIIFLLATIPGAILAFNREFGYPIMARRTVPSVVFHRVVQTLFLLCSATNFLVYYAFNRKFKEVCFKFN